MCGAAQAGQVLGWGAAPTSVEVARAEAAREGTVEAAAPLLIRHLLRGAASGGPGRCGWPDTDKARLLST